MILKKNIRCYFARPRPAGLVPGAGRRLVDDEGRRPVTGLFSQPARAPRAIDDCARVSCLGLPVRR